MTLDKSLNRLEKIIEIMSENETTLEESLKLFEEGTLIAEDCRKQLNKAQLKIETLSKKGENDE